MHHGRNIAKLPSIKQSGATIIRVLTSILERGAKEGVFRSGVSAIDLHLFISAFCVFRVSNRFTFGKIFDTDLSDPATRTRHKKIFTEAVLRYLEPALRAAGRLTCASEFASSEIAASRFEAEPRVLLGTQGRKLGDIRNLDRQGHLRQAPDDGADVDAAFTQVETFRATDSIRSSRSVE